MNDKLKHFLAGFAIAALVTVIAAPYADRPLGLAAAAVMLAAAGKEVWDAMGHGTPDWLDIVATLAGWVPVALAFTYLFQ